MCMNGCCASYSAAFAGLLPLEDLYDIGGSALAIAMSGPAVRGCAVRDSFTSGQIRLAGA
jgi:hypothetical protein